MANLYSGILITHVKEMKQIVLENLIIFIKICYGPYADVGMHCLLLLWAPLWILQGQCGLPPHC